MRLRISLAMLLALSGPVGLCSAAELSEREQTRKAMNDEHDRQALRQRREFVTDCTPRFVREPDTRPHGDYTTATVPPAVKLQILPDLVPEHFSGAKQYMACWANWGYVTRSDDNRFYCAASDHLGRGADVNVYEYDPRTNGVRKAIDIDDVLGWTDDSYTDGKIHGHMGIMPDGTLWGATHEGVHPTDEWFAAGYRGSWLFSFNIHTREARNWGTPLIGESLPCHELDVARGRFVAASSAGAILCWDCEAKTIRYAGYPPKGWLWWPRSLLGDAATGTFWGLDMSDDEHHFMSYDPELSRFERYALTVPANPIKKTVGKLRGHTPAPAMDGYYYWATINGALFRFKPESPDGPVAEPVGVTWDEGRDTLQMALSPEGRYVYYYPKGNPAPVVQYDVKTGRHKALCWLQDHYFETYGYWMDHVYGMDISNDGSFLVVCINGEFTGKRSNSFGHPALLVISIPEKERPLD